VADISAQHAEVDENVSGSVGCSPNLGRKLAHDQELEPKAVHGYRWLFGPTYPYVGSYHAVSGSLDPAEAVALLDSLHLPADTDHLLQLYAVLLRGRREPLQDPTAWRA
jgi:hypothetical protein